MALPAYIQMVKKNRQVVFSSTAMFYGDSSFVYFQKDKKDGLEKISLAKFVKMILAKQYVTSPDIYGPLPTFPCDTIEMKIDLARFKKIWNQRNIGTVIKIDPQDYLTNDQFMVLDVINSEVYNRPIFFTSDYTLLSPYLLLAGAVLQFLPLDATKVNISRRITIDKTKAFLSNYRIVPSEFSFSDITATGKDAEVLGLHSMVVQYYLQNNRKDSAAAVLQQLMNRYGGKLPVLLDEFSIPEWLMATGRIPEGRRLLEECSDSFYKQYNHPSSLYGYKSHDATREFVKNAQILLVKYGTKSNRLTDLIEKLDREVEGQ